MIEVYLIIYGLFNLKILHDLSSDRRKPDWFLSCLLL